MPSKSSRVLIFATALCLFAAIPSGFSQTAQPTLDPLSRQQVDAMAREILQTTGVPSATVAIVKDGQLAYAAAYGSAHLDPVKAAEPAMRYSIGSISKQFTATAILMLAEQHKLSLDDPVAKFIPDLTRAKEVNIRELLSHTSGYQDFWPQDYVPPFMRERISAQKILDLWARKPLDFDPGTKWQYSNTNYVIAGLIVEKASGMPLLRFLSQRIFTPLDMRSVMDVDQNHLTETDATGYSRFALGPPRQAPDEGPGWMFAAGELAMPASDLAKWDISMIDQKLMQPASYREMQTEVRLKNGLGTRYGLGLDIVSEEGHRALEHGGEVSGFTSENIVFPDDRAAIVVLTNEDAANAASAIARRVAPLLFPDEDKNKDAALAQAKQIFQGLQQGKIDRPLFTANCNDYFSPQAVADYASSLGPLGAPIAFVQMVHTERGGMSFRLYAIKFPQKTVQIWLRAMPDGKIEQFQVMAAE